LNPLEAGGAEAVFDEPWQAQAFALTVQLHRQGAFTWTEWTRALSEQIAAAGPDDGAGYYASWLAALEGLVATKGLAGPNELAARKAAWDEAWRATPHGRPVELPGVLVEDIHRLSPMGDRRRGS